MEDNRTYIYRLLENGKYRAYVNGHVVGEYSTITKALEKMAKYAKSQNL